MDYFSLLHNNDEKNLNNYIEKQGVNSEVQGYSLLYWAVFKNNIIFTRQLIEQGAEINKKDDLNRSVLSVACYYGFYEILKLLIESGAEIDDACFKRAQRGWDGHQQFEIIELLSKVKK